MKGGRRSTSFKPGVSGNPRGRPRKARPDAAEAGVWITMTITPSGASALRRRGLIAAGQEREPKAVANGLLEAAARYLFS